MQIKKSIKSGTVWIQKIKSLTDTLKNDFLIKAPKIAILAINPHVGDNGVIGSDDQNILIPAITDLNKDNNLIFAAADFNFSDLDGDPLSLVQITLLPATGTLFIDDRWNEHGIEREKDSTTYLMLVLNNNQLIDEDKAFRVNLWLLLGHY